jgi:UDP-3-O-[3-hydroxymyristoyl] N-acetylglucosamine deacetylase
LFFPHPVIGEQTLRRPVRWGVFIREIARPERSDFKKTPKSFKPGAWPWDPPLRTSVVLDDKDVISGPLRFPDEFVRHKLLDLIGDLALLAGRSKPG